MGGYVSKFNGVLHESVVCLGTGIFGFTSTLFSGRPNVFYQFLLFSTLGTAAVITFLNFRDFKDVNENNIILISGCDSGLGYNMALKCYELNMTVICGCLNTASEGAEKLRLLSDNKRILITELDIRRTDTIANVYKMISAMLQRNKNFEFTALVNNAGVMCFGEFEWQTDNIIENQININLIGTMKLTRKFLPLIREFKARIITVTSHCALQALPGLGPYAASKAGLLFWNDSLRVEMKKYGVKVINFIPGSFVLSSNITARQHFYAEEMRNSFSEEQQKFYGNYFESYNEYLKIISGYRQVDVIKDEILMGTFENALLSESPRTLYKHEPFRYKIYHTLFKIAPTTIRDWLVVKFMCMPEYNERR